MKKWLTSIVLALTGASGAYYGAVVTPSSYEEGQVIGAADVRETPTDSRGRPDTSKAPRNVKRYAYTGARLPDLPSEDTTRRTISSRTFHTDKPETFVTEIVGGEPQYFQDDAGQWWQAEYATTSKAAFLLKPKSKHYREKHGIIAAIFIAYAATDTFYPSPGTTVDGTLVRHIASATWSDVRDGDGTISLSSNATASFIYLETGSNQYKEIDRSVFVFDTSSIPDTNTIDSATFSVYITGKNTTLTGQSVRLVASTLASDSSLANSDYEGTNGNTTAYASDIALSGISTSAYLDFAMNSTGKAAVNKTGNTRLGLRLASDADNAAPGTSAGTVAAEIAGRYSDNTGTSEDPKLVVTHTTPAAVPAPGVIFFD